MTHLEDQDEDWQITQAPVMSLNAVLQQKLMSMTVS